MHNNRKIYIILFGLTLSLFSYSAFSRNETTVDPIVDSTPDTTTPAAGSKGWPSDLYSKISADIGEEIDNTSVEITYAIFDAIVENELFSKTFNSGIKFEVEVDRDIYYNNDIYSSYSVVDHFQMPASIPLNLHSSTPGDLVSLGVSLSSSINLNMYNIRQVKPKNLSDIPPISNLKKEIIVDVTDATDEEDDDDSGFDWSNLQKYILVDKDNPLHNAMYGKLWNVLVNPLRLPFTKKNFDKLDKQEIFSYGINGTVQLGASLGWSQAVIEGYAPSFGVGVSTYLSGQFRVSIMKEKDNSALLKLSRISERGASSYFGSASTDMTLFNGFTILTFDEIGKTKMKMIPFSFSANTRLNKTIDVAYRYDFNKPDAWQAYVDATKGMMKKSEDLSKEEGSGVVRAFDRTRIFREHSNNYKMEMLFFFEKSRNSRARFSHATIHLPKGEYKIFKAVSETTRQFDFSFLGKEQKSYNFTLTIDENRFRRTREGLDLRVIMKKYDSNTSGKELRKYIEEMENVSGQSDVFPTVPLYEPIPAGEVLCDNTPMEDDKTNNCYTPVGIDYEKSDFYYRLNFSSDKVYNFLELSKEEIWTALEKGFGVKPGVWSKHWKQAGYQILRSPLMLLNLPLFLGDLHIKEGNQFIAALKFYRNWKKLRGVNTPNEFVKRFSKLFHVNHYSREYLYAFMAAVGRPEKMEYKGTNSELFGTISRGSIPAVAIDELAAKDELVFNFDQIGGRDYNIDHDSKLTSFDVKVIDDDNISINVELPTEGTLPKYIFFRVDRAGFFKYKNLMTGVVLNTGLLKAGMNKITISRDSSEGLLGKLAKHLFKGDPILISMAVGQDGHSWGTLYQSKIKTIAPPKPPKPPKKPADNPIKTEDH